MVRKLRELLVVGAVLATWAGAHDGLAQDTVWRPAVQSPSSGPQPSAQVGRQPTVVTTMPRPPATQPPPASAAAGVPLAVVPPPEDSNGSLLYGDPMLDPPDLAPPGWFVALGVDLVGPHIKNRLTAPVTVAGIITDTVHLPSAEMGWVGSPRVELGYRFEQGFGEFLASYRSLVAETTEIFPAYDVFGDGLLRTRLNLNVVDLDYGSREFGLFPAWDMKWRVGARIASVYFDSRAAGLLLGQRTSNSFFGAGPHVGLDLWRSLPVPGMGIFARVDGSAIVGRINQSYEETILFPNGTAIGGATSQHGSQTVPVLSFQAGLGWKPWADMPLRLSAGYQFEQWWYLGQVEGSRAELTVQGIFLRGELGF